MVLVALQPRFQIKVQQYTVRRYIVWYQMKQLNSMETLFFFIFNMIIIMWQRNMTGKTKSWPVKSPISLGIVSWPAIISSPAPWCCFMKVQDNSPGLFPLPKGAVWFTFSPSQPPMAEIPVLSGSCFSFKILAFQVLHPLRIWIIFMGWVWIF